MFTFPETMFKNSAAWFAINEAPFQLKEEEKKTQTGVKIMTQNSNAEIHANGSARVDREAEDE